MPVFLLNGMTKDVVTAEGVQFGQELVGILDDSLSCLCKEKNKLKMYRGDDYTVRIIVENTSGDIQDISSASIWFTIKDKTDLDRDDTYAILQLRNVFAGGSDNEIKISSTINGVFEIFVSPLNTADIDPDKYEYDIQIKLAGNDKVYTILRNKINILADVTTECV